MDILQQCQKWHENDEYQKIIDALEAIPNQERTPEMDNELARAYNNLAGPEDRELLKKAIHLLKPHEEYFAGDHRWNFRMGYSYYYLDQEGRALPYFRKALEACPGDEDTQEFIDWCEKGIALPRFSKCFRERTENCWETFAKMERSLRQMMDEDSDHTHGPEITNQMENVLNLVFDEISFEMGVSGEKYELILTPEGDKVKLFELVYFRKHAPKEVLEHWNIQVGRQPIRNIILRTDDDWDISGEDVQIWLEEQGKNSFAISAYCEKLLPLLREEEGRAWWMLTTLTDQVLGEIPHMRYIESFDVLEKPKAEPSIRMSQLSDKLKERGLELSTDPEAFLESYIGYQIKPNEDPDADWRLDVLAGSTCCVPLVNGYLNSDNDFMDDLHADGAVAGFFCYPLDTLREEEGSQKIFDFRDKLEEALTAGDGPEVLTLTGGATGLYCGYVDFIAWDIRTALKIATEFFEDSGLPWASFHTFRREASSVSLKNTQEAFFQQLERWNDEDEYTRCIQECKEEIAKRASNEDDGEHDPTGRFAGSVLLSKAEWNKEQFIRDLQEEWGIVDEEPDQTGEDEENNSDAVVMRVGGMMLVAALFPGHIPDNEAEINAENNYMWPEAVETAKAHKAHIMVAVLGEEEKLLEQGKLFTKALAVCCKQTYATGIYTSGVVFEPRFYEGFADMMKEDELPIFNWIWFGLYRSEDGINAYTYGMDVFGKDEMEVLNADAEPGELRNFLASLASYVLACDVTLKDGETIGFAADDKHSITRSPGVGLPKEQMTLKISYAPTDGDSNDSGNDDTDSENPQDENSSEPEVYIKEERETIEGHIRQYFGKVENIFHELVSPDIHVDICIVPPTEERDYYTLVTMGMGAHRMNVPEELAEYKLERAELAIALPKDWKLDRESMQDERWYWPIRLLKVLARLPISSDTWLGYGHTMDNEQPFAENTKLCAIILTGPQNTKNGGEVCTLPGGEEVKLYQVIPLYEDELNYKLEYDADALMDKMADISFVVRPDRPNAVTRGTVCNGDDEDTLEPSDVAQAIMKYLDCACTYFPSMADDDPIMSAYSYARRLGVREGFIPVLVKPDETLLECLVMNADPKNEANCYEFDREAVAEYRKKMLAAPIKDGKAILEELTGQRKEEAEDDDMDWQEEVLGEMADGYDNCRFASYWNSDTDMTSPLILAKIPVKNPWEIFAYLPFGNWNECPDTPELMAVAKYWFEQYGAVPAVMTHDELEFDLPATVSKEKAMEVAVEQYGFCPDMDQNFDELGALADTLRQSTVWYFWWD